jgi:cell division protein FtsB
MTAERKPIISPENQPTALAVTFIIALLALVIGFYNVRQIRDVAVFYGQITKMTAQKAAEGAHGAKRVDDLEARLKKLESELAAARTTPAPAVEAPIK